MRMRITQPWRIFLLAILVIVLAESCKLNAAKDMLILRDGSLRTGRLDGCNAQACTFDGAALSRSAILFIGLNGVQPTPPQVQDWLEDEVRRVDGSAHGGRVSSVDANRVITANGSHPRSKVSWIYFAPRKESTTDSATPGPWSSSRSSDSKTAGVVYEWDGKIEVESTYNGKDGLSKWKAEYLVKFLEKPSTSSRPGKTPGTSIPAREFFPLALKYTIHADTNLNKGSHTLQTDAVGKILYGDLTMRGQANGAITADALETGLVLSVGISGLDAPAKIPYKPPTSFATPREFNDFRLSVEKEHGFYDISLSFLHYGSVRGLKPYSPEYFKAIRELYRGIDRGGRQPLVASTAEQDFIMHVPQGMPQGVNYFGILNKPDQTDVRGGFSYPIREKHQDPEMIKANWTFKRTRR